VRKDLFQPNLKLPIVREVVLVAKAFKASQPEITQFHFSVIILEQWSTVTWHSVLASANDKLVQVKIR
jgi:hypothetical protein